ncbi:MAG TPA: molybdate ABC transporter substrate-binding protein, partial [Alteraurantiacibacter sp.]
MNVIRKLAIILAFAVAACSGAGGEQPPTVLAAASMQEALTEAADQWEASGRTRPALSFAASPALARQVESGAPADIFISADERWMDRIEADGLVRQGTRKVVAENGLVLIAPRDCPA